MKDIHITISPIEGGSQNIIGYMINVSDKYKVFGECWANFLGKKSNGVYNLTHNLYKTSFSAVKDTRTIYPEICGDKSAERFLYDEAWKFARARNAISISSTRISRFDNLVSIVSV
jgi:hypothetical protein